jgi:hypothetical protein
LSGGVEVRAGFFRGLREELELLQGGLQGPEELTIYLKKKLEMAFSLPRAAPT